MMEPEQQISSESVYSGRIVNLRVDKVSLPNGREATREIVEHASAVVLVAIDDDDNALLVRQFRYPVGETLLEAPAGIVEEGETPDDTAQRELQEETGFASRNLRPIGGFWSSPGFTNEFMYAYLAKNLVPSSLDADDDENIQVERIPMSRIPRLIRLGEIQDAKTIAAMLMAIQLFENS
jgi:ADP-ribose pyrophosphatase